MVCKNCGKEIDEGTKFCPECGAAQVDVALNNAEAKNEKAQSSPESAQASGKLAEYNTMCIVGLIVAVISLFLTAYGVIGIAGIVLSYLGFKKCKEENKKGKELAIIGMVLGAYSAISGIFTIIYVLMIKNAVTGITTGIMGL